MVTSFFLCSDWVPIEHLCLGMGNGNITVLVNSEMVGASPHFATWTPRGLDSEDLPHVLWLEVDPMLGSFRMPLWIPLLILAVPTIVLWRLDRRGTTDGAPCGIKGWLTPRRPARITVWQVIAFTVLHVALVLGLNMVLVLLRVSPTKYVSESTYVLLSAILGAFLFSAPIFGYFWARALKNYRNLLLAVYYPHMCLTCGYDLTGNVSRVCPECGTAPVRKGVQHDGAIDTER